ncbi:hypothetical protein L486_08528 [Kwoniella mangroviensis CBS 10435]|uniref:Uncharacterized protein n=1 Tax=Kwoniella mangroviensis CBS 10435 TaxID=1331196 RepID=A0A1B9IEV1_9TREE|nr:uncharacterized protein I203_08273 [Kwoniella mangroviensis CBS 8507]OCF53971.1 hypothetical protein L486_08528 [Kwoniella mangroviensis CBS 10435]OCF62641.1 hypothetical protein I203_08273 [Kwoniella mangroviensis CBS 8507]OCF71009.1 hypothetical protein I204_08245 [Kwoniella mangroviensis CBS 8886]
MSAQEDIQKAEASINSYQAKTGLGETQSDSTIDSGVNENVTSQFPGSTVQIGGTKRGENPLIPDEEGGEQSKLTGRQTHANDFEGDGGPEDKVKVAEAQRPGDQDVSGNIRG